LAQRVVRLPDIGEGTTEAEIVAWLVKPGDVVQEEDPLAEVMTDKATVEIPSPVGGTVVSINGAPGQKLAVGADLVVLETGQAARPVLHVPTANPQEVVEIPATASADNVDIEAPAPHPPTPAARVPPPPRGRGEGQGEGRAAAQNLSGRSAKPLASPAVRKRAGDAGIALQFVPGSGPGGRITHDDLNSFIARGGGAPAPAAFAQRDGVEEVRLVGLRRAIAEHLSEAWRRIPHFSYIEEVDVTAVEELRAHLNETRSERGRLTLLPFIIRAMINAVVDYPEINARFDDESGVVHRHRAVHVGVATQTPSGLMVPVLRHAEALDPWQAAAEIVRLLEAARAGKATREELTGSTITITSLGALGGLAATPVINAPEVAIVGVNRIVERPVVHGGEIVVRKVMNLSSSFDHRVVDGWDAASFVAKVKAQLEHPATLFLP
jgi:2-oxoisovalerate dehydrogenase E2 component (dihydrolipoyl transacylase)